MLLRSGVFHLPKSVYDLLVIGGGSGGVACATQAAKLGASVALVDYVPPSPYGTSWGLGGTCVNVGCIPKKLFHVAAQQGEILSHMAPYFGWGLCNSEKDSVPRYRMQWSTLRENVTNYIRSLNFSTRVACQELNVDYVNARAWVTGEHGHGACVAVRCTDPDSSESSTTMHARHVVVATGGRPQYPSIPRAQRFGITSDDLFWLNKDPEKVVVVGAGYIALECAGFLGSFAKYASHEGERPLNRPSVLVRSTPLRGFDKDAVARVVQSMADSVDFVYDQPKELVRVESNVASNSPKLRLHTMKGGVMDCDTVLFAMGRRPQTTGLGFDTLGVKIDPSTHHIITDEFAKTSHPQVYAIGDVVRGGAELTPVAIRSGRTLANNLFSERARETVHFFAQAMPTTVFTPLEYGRIGPSEEQACALYPEKQIEVYHTAFCPLEWTLPGLPRDLCFLKVITRRDLDAPLDADNARGRDTNETVIGWHLTCPHAGEITQGIAVAMHAGLTLRTLRQTMGIHPTMAECIGSLVRKRDFPTPKVPGC